MHTSPYFLDLRSAYQSELDDLTSDSEGRDVLRKRLTEKRTELGFLLKMMEISPEMVVVVLHQAFRFTSPVVMDQLLRREADDLPPWSSLHDAMEIAGWARDMVQTILKEPMGKWFMTIASALEYMHNRPLLADARAQQGAAPDDENDQGEGQDEGQCEGQGDCRDDDGSEDHDAEESEARAREEAGNDWMVAQGFDRKE